MLLVVVVKKNASPVHCTIQTRASSLVCLLFAVMSELSNDYKEFFGYQTLEVELRC